jgi:hypothetical protein
MGTALVFAVFGRRMRPTRRVESPVDPPVSPTSGPGREQTGADPKRKAFDMPGTCYINAVRLVYPPNRTHPHIGWVRLTTNEVESREAVIRYILREGWIYYTSPPSGSGAKVIVADCPYCGSGDYITTEPDSTEANNLLDLPRF